jgi:hypothetical protein
MSLANAIRFMLLSVLVLPGQLLGDSWEVTSPGLNGSDYKFVATLAPPASSSYVSSKRPQHATHYKATLWIDPRGIAMPENGSATRFLLLIDDTEGGADQYGGTIVVGFLRNVASDHAWHAIFWNLEDAGNYRKAVEISLGSGSQFPMEMEIEFWTGGVGTTTFCARKPGVSGSEVCASDFDMENADVDEMRIGTFGNGNPAGYTGSFEIDEVRTSW